MIFIKEKEIGLYLYSYNADNGFPFTSSLQEDGILFDSTEEAQEVLNIVGEDLFEIVDE